MSYQSQWKSLAARMRGLISAGELYSRSLSVDSIDMYGTGRSLKKRAANLLVALAGFRDQFQTLLPRAADEALENLYNDTASLVVENSFGPLVPPQVISVLVRFAAFESEITFLLSDDQISIRSRSELAFAHLRRQIVVDESVRLKWEASFNAGEVACERLGAIHLLSHGIWAFKVNAEGGRTDLVYQEIVRDLGGDQRFAEGLVLTEWKLLRDGESAADKFAQARAQARSYAAGVLAGTELVGFRFAVVVSKTDVVVPVDVIDGGVLYRHVHVPLSPRLPSDLSRSARGGD